MQHEHVLSGLMHKRAEIAGHIERTQHSLRKLVLELDSVDAAIRIFDPEADIHLIKPKHYPARHAAFRGEMLRFVLGAFRAAKGQSLTSLEIAQAVANGRGLRADDSELIVTIRKRVGACLWKLKRDGHIEETEAIGNYKEWRLTGRPL